MRCARPTRKPSVALYDPVTLRWPGQHYRGCRPPLVLQQSDNLDLECLASAGATWWQILHCPGRWPDRQRFAQAFVDAGHAAMSARRYTRAPRLKPGELQAWRSILPPERHPPGDRGATVEARLRAVEETRMQY